MNKKLLAGMVAGLFLFSMVGMANATIITADVYASANSSFGGSGLNTGINLTSGQEFTTSAGLGDLWNAGPLPRWSNADGLIADLIATGSDDSAQISGTIIGQAFTYWTQNGLSAPYGSLVGEINGSFTLLGTNFIGNAWGDGDLLLYYWDSNSYDNTEFISVTVNDSPAPVPEPSTMLLLGSGLVGLVWYRRKLK